MSERTNSFSRDETQNGFAAALRRPAFVVLWLSETLSLIGDRLIMVALVMQVYERTRSPADVGILMMLKAIPSLAMGGIAGMFVDRWNRKRVMAGANLIQGLLVLMIPFSNTLLPVYSILCHGGGQSILHAYPRGNHPQLGFTTDVAGGQLEPPRDCRRLNSLREYSHGQRKQVFTRGTGTGRQAGR